MSTKTIKFSEVPIGAMFKHDGIICLKVDDYFFYDFKSTILRSFYSITDDEVELITKCANCKHYNKDVFGEDYGFFYCNKIKVNYPDGVQAEFKEDAENFSCSSFEGKI